MQIGTTGIKTQAERPRTLSLVGTTAQGHYRLSAASLSCPGTRNEVLVSADGLRVSCACTACRSSRGAKNGRRTVARADVLAGKVGRCCWLLRNAARWAPLRVATLEVRMAAAAGRICRDMTEAEAAEVAAVAAWEDEDAEGYEALLIEEAEARDGYHLSARFGPYSDF